jgi:hypothetical protein
MSAWANQLKCIFENIFNSSAICLFATKPLIFPEAALSSEVVDSESTSIKLTLNKFAVGKKAALKFACFEFDIHEDRLTKVAPIPVAPRKLTTKKESMHHCTFGRYPLKGAIPVEVLSPVRAIAFCRCVGFTIELHAL